LTPNLNPTVGQGLDPYNPYRMPEPSTAKGQQKKAKVEASWYGGQEKLWDVFGPGALTEVLRRLYQGQQALSEPILGGYEGALKQYAGALPGYRQEMGQAAGDYERRVMEALRGYGQEARGAAGAAYGQGLQAISRGQSQINQDLAARMARTGLAGTGMGQARGALGSAAGTFALPGLQAGYAGQLAGIGGQEAQIRQALAERLFGAGQGVAETGLGFAGGLLGGQRDLTGLRMGVLDQASQQARENLYQRMGLTPDIWRILGQQGTYDRSRNFDWGALARAGLGAGLGAFAGPVGAAAGAGIAGR